METIVYLLFMALLAIICFCLIVLALIATLYYVQRFWNSFYDQWLDWKLVTSPEFRVKMKQEQAPRRKPVTQD